jgi:trimethylamine--corrinoid protein Co-methyltransferase
MTTLDETLRPALRLLTREQVERIVDQAFEVLATVGVEVRGEEARRLLAGAGQRLEVGRAYLDREALEAALASAPPRLLLADRDGAPAADLAGRKVSFTPGSTALHVLDRETLRRRSPTARDAVHLAWITEACRHLAVQSTALVPADVPEVLSDSYRLYLALCNSKKPVVTGTFRADSFAVMRDLLAAVRGGADELGCSPLAVFDCCSTPPLKWSELSCRGLVDCARAGIPAELISVPLGGATAPVTLREMVVQHCAESLSGLLIHQLAGPGSPVVYGGAPAAFDMRHGTLPMGAVETMMVDVACAQVGRRLGLPTHAYMALSDAKTADWQAGAETAMGAALAVLGGVNLVAGPGILDFIGCQSLEKLVLDNEACGAALRLGAGVGHGSAGEATELLRAVVEAEHFLGHRHTRRSFRRELHMPGPAIDRATYGDWQRGGGRDAFAAAAAEVDRLVERGNPAPLDADLEEALAERMGSEADRLGVELPARLRTPS